MAINYDFSLGEGLNWHVQAVKGDPYAKITPASILQGEESQKRKKVMEALRAVQFPSGARPERERPEYFHLFNRPNPEGAVIFCLAMILFGVAICCGRLRHKLTLGKLLVVISLTFILPILGIGISCHRLWKWREEAMNQEQISNFLISLKGGLHEIITTDISLNHKMYKEADIARVIWLHNAIEV